MARTPVELQHATVHVSSDITNSHVTLRFEHGPELHYPHHERYALAALFQSGKHTHRNLRARTTRNVTQVDLLDENNKVIHSGVIAQPSKVYAQLSASPAQEFHPRGIPTPYLDQALGHIGITQLYVRYDYILASDPSKVAPLDWTHHEIEEQWRVTVVIARNRHENVARLDRFDVHLRQWVTFLELPKGILPEYPAGAPSHEGTAVGNQLVFEVVRALLEQAEPIIFATDSHAHFLQKAGEST